jgi:hypothetical protein
MSAGLLNLLLVLAGTCALLSAIWVASRAMRAARRSSSSVGTFGWALLFLTSARMPPPPPASQIEVEMDGEKDRGFSDPLRRPANNSLERSAER